MEDGRTLQEELKRKRLIQQILELASPQLRAQIERQERERDEEVEATRRKKQRAESQERAESLEGMLQEELKKRRRELRRLIVAIFVWIGVAVAIVYGFVKFVKWAWLN